jgi:hypothetical protein
MRRHHVEAARLAVSVRPLERLDQGQESGCAGRETRGGRGLEHPGQTIAMTSRRFSPPWTVKEYRGISYIVRDANNFPVAYVYFESESGRRAAANLMTKGEARKIAAGIAKLPELLLKPRDEKDPGAG